jgi:hypothetical protein
MIFCALRGALVFFLAVVCSLSISVSSVEAQPSIVTGQLPDGQVGIPYNSALLATGADPPFTWSIVTGAPPPGLTLNANGTITGTPTATGPFSFIAKVTDNLSATDQRLFIITIVQPPLTITTVSFPQAMEGTPYAANIGVSGGTPPYSASIIGGSLPQGLLLDATSGFISGTPRLGTAGTHSFTISVTDSSSPARTGQRSLSIYIEEGSYQPTITIGSSLTAGKTKVYVNGREITVLGGGESTNLDVGLGESLSISVDPIVEDPAEAGTRYRVKEEETIVTELQPSASFIYYTEYLISIEAKPSEVVEPAGSGWYQKDSTLNTSANTEVKGEPGIKYGFSHWLLPDNKKVGNEDLGFTVAAPGTVTAVYDTYYLLTIESIYGQAEGGGWYQAGTEAKWHLISDTVPMSGIIGLFQGKYKAVNFNGTELMDAPSTVNVFWEPDNTMPYILIPITILVLLLLIFGIYYLLFRPRPGPVPTGPPIAAIPPRPIGPRPIPQHTTVVMIGDKESKQKQLPQTTKEQLMERFGELLERYEDEIRTTMGPKGLPGVETISEDKRLGSPKPVPPGVAEAEVSEYGEEDEEDQYCNFSSKKLVRTVTTPWIQLESNTTTVPSRDKDKTKGGTGLSVVWARDIYHEWEIHTCSLQTGHKGKHKGSVEIVYSFLNTVTEKKSYGPRQKLRSPTPHFTDGMPELEVADDQIIPADELPEDTTR